VILEHRRLGGPLTGTGKELRELAGFYRRELCDNIIPWWTKHALDRSRGGVFSCIKDDGTVVSRDKYVWSQTRALWTFSAACNRIEDRSEWREAADGLFRFCVDRCQTPNGDWNFVVDREGAVVEGPESIQTDAFAINALVEYARMTGNEESVDAAQRTYAAVMRKLGHPGSYDTAPFPIPEGTKAHKVSMQFSLSFTDLGRYLSDSKILASGLELTDDVLYHYYRPERKAIVEYLALNDHMLSPPVGTYMDPGHGVETAWFQIENLRGRPELEDGDRMERILGIVSCSLERGWDEEYGGLFLGVDIDGGKPYLENADSKIWYPHCEALCGTLMAYELSREPWCLEWYHKIHNWSFSHFPDRKHGEWTQRLDRRGARMNTVVALPVKDPFHLPRAFIYCVEVLERMEGRKQ